MGGGWKTAVLITDGLTAEQGTPTAKVMDELDFPLPMLDKGISFACV
jgi:hypothetical protein